MEFFVRGMNDDTSRSEFDESSIHKCPFLRNITKPTSFAFSASNLHIPLPGVKGPIFEDGPNFDSAFKLFHGKDGVVPLSSGANLQVDSREAHCIPQFNPLASKVATISLSAFLPFGFGWSFNNKKNKQNKKPKPAHDKDSGAKKKEFPNHEAMGNEWLENGNCPIAKSFRAVSLVLPLVASTLQPLSGSKFRCPQAVVAARAALARTAFVKNLRPQPLPTKMFIIALLGMAANIPLGIWREHTVKFSLSWFTAVHAAVPFIAMLRKSVVMPKNAMAVTIVASILGQVIGSRAERYRLKEQQRDKHLDKTTFTSSCGSSEIDEPLESVFNKAAGQSSNGVCC